MGERRRADLVRALLESLACRLSLPRLSSTVGIFELSLRDNHFPVDFESHRAATLSVLASIAKDEVEVGGFADADVVRQVVSLFLARTRQRSRAVGCPECSMNVDQTIIVIDSGKTK